MSTLRRRALLWGIPGILLAALGAVLFALEATRELHHRDQQLRQRQLAQTRAQLESMEQALRRTLMEYAFWDPTADFVAFPDPSWAEENLAPWLKGIYALDFVMVVNPAGRVVYAADPTGQHRAGDEVSDSPLLQLALERPGEAALWQGGETPVYLAAAMIQPENSEYRFTPYSEGKGVFLLGQVLSAEVLQSLSEKVGASARLVFGEEYAATSEEGVAAVLAGPGGEPAAAVVLTTDATRAEARWGGFGAIILYFLAVQLIALTLFIISGERTIAQPLRALQQAIAELRTKGILSATRLAQRKDEVGSVARAIVDLEEELEEAERSRARVEDGLARQALQQSVVAELGLLALSEVDLSELMHVATAQIASTLDVELCKILELLPGGEELLLREGVGWKNGYVGKATVSAGPESQAGYTLQSQEAVVIDDLRTETRFAGPELLIEHGVVSGLSVAIGGPDRPYGVLGAHTARQRSFTSDDVHFLQAVANLLAKTIRTTQMEEELSASRERLRQAQKMEAIGRLAGGVAHDFNNLLTGINGYTELVLERVSEDDPLRSDLVEVARAGERAATLTRQLSAFSRQQVLRPRALDLNAAVTEVERLLRRTIGEDIEFATALDPALGTTVADPGQMEQVLMNLAINARDAMPAGGRLTIETANAEVDEQYAGSHPGAEPGRYVLLSITDNGCGMDEETRLRAFEPFFTTKERGEGTGLGLSTVYGIVKQSGGYIGVTSEPGKGTTFEIFLPRVDEAVETTEWKETPAEPAGGSETVLVVEDEQRVRGFLARILKARGYQVLLAQHAEEALQISRNHGGSIELVVTDIVMPGATGVELMDWISAERPETRSLYISGYAGKRVLENGTLGTHQHFLAKPFSGRSLALKVREVLDLA